MVNKNFVRTTHDGRDIYKKKDGNVFFLEEAQDLYGNLIRLGTLINYDQWSFDAQATGKTAKVIDLYTYTTGKHRTGTYAEIEKDDQTTFEAATASIEVAKTQTIDSVDPDIHHKVTPWEQKRLNAGWDFTRDAGWSNPNEPLKIKKFLVGQRVQTIKDKLPGVVGGFVGNTVEFIDSRGILLHFPSEQLEWAPEGIQVTLGIKDWKVM